LPSERSVQNLDGVEMTEWINFHGKKPSIGDYIAIEKENKIYICTYIGENQCFPLSMKGSNSPIWNFEFWLPVNFML
jgi:hypothetical protein